jgi:hypothetical protein
MRGKTRVVVAAIIGYFFGAVAAHACGGGKVIYQDDFKTLDPAWNAPDNVTAVNGAMSVKLVANVGLTMVSQANLYTQPSIEICSTFKLVSGLGSPTDSAGAAAIFWASGSTNFTQVEILPAAGTAKSSALIDNKWTTKVPPRSVSAESTAVGGTNDLDVVVNGGRVQATVNGKPAVYIIGTPPTSSWMVGLYFESPGSTATEWQVMNYQVREGAGP